MTDGLPLIERVAIAMAGGPGMWAQMGGTQKAMWLEVARLGLPVALEEAANVASDAGQEDIAERIRNLDEGRPL